MREHWLESHEVRSNIPPFFHLWITVDKNGLIFFNQDALEALEHYIHPYVQQLETKDHELHSRLKVSDLSETVVAQATENLEAEWKLHKAEKLRRMFGKFVEWKLKKKEKKDLVSKVEKKMSPQHSYVLPIEYLNANLDREVFKIDFVLWSDSTTTSIIESLEWKRKIHVWKGH